MGHRVLPTAHGVYATALSADLLLHLQPARTPSGPDERSDAFGLWGYGAPGARIVY
jgi:hypothetical protein